MEITRTRSRLSARFKLCGVNTASLLCFRADTERKYHLIMDFNRMNRAEIADYLKKRDFSSSRLKKSDLVTLAEHVSVLNVPVIEADDTSQCEVN